MYAISVDVNEIPRRPDGELFPFVFVAPGGEALFSDTLTEIVENIIVGYADCQTPEERFELLLESLTTLSAQTQAAIVAASPDGGSLEEEELTALFTPKDEGVDMPVWTRELPLLLLVTSFHPFTEFPQPRGESVVWLNPINERTYLESLEALGVGELSVHEDF